MKDPDLAHSELLEADLPLEGLSELRRRVDAGDDDIESLWPLLYGELKTLARLVLKGRRHSDAPQTTTLVHEAYLRFVGGSRTDWNDRNHFLAIAARAMRFVLVDDARRRLSNKRGGAERPATLDDALADRVPDAFDLRAEEVLSVHQALQRLANVNPRYVRLVELRFFAGFSVQETADVMGLSRPTVVRDWRAVRVWLHQALADADSSSQGSREGG